VNVTRDSLWLQSGRTSTLKVPRVTTDPPKHHEFTTTMHQRVERGLVRRVQQTGTLDRQPLHLPGVHSLGDVQDVDSHAVSATR